MNYVDLKDSNLLKSLWGCVLPDVSGLGTRSERREFYKKILLPSARTLLTTGTLRSTLCKVDFGIHLIGFGKRSLIEGTVVLSQTQDPNVNGLPD